MKAGLILKFRVGRDYASVHHATHPGKADGLMGGPDVDAAAVLRTLQMLFKPAGSCTSPQVDNQMRFFRVNCHPIRTKDLEGDLYAPHHKLKVAYIVDFPREMAVVCKEGH